MSSKADKVALDCTFKQGSSPSPLVGSESRQGLHTPQGWQSLLLGKQGMLGTRQGSAACCQAMATWALPNHAFPASASEGCLAAGGGGCGDTRRGARLSGPQPGAQVSRPVHLPQPQGSGRGCRA